MQSTTIDISESILNDINALDENYSIIAYDNDVTPFDVVFYVLKTVVPLSDQQAYDVTYAIHVFGKESVYTGSLNHCEKIANALKNVHVKSEIIKN